MTTLLRGRILTFHGDPAETEDNHRYIEDGAILVENGIIVGIGDYSELADSALPVIDHRPHLIMPGLIDPHIHFPQVQVTASWGKQLLDWLNGTCSLEKPDSPTLVTRRAWRRSSSICFWRMGRRPPAPLPPSIREASMRFLLPPRGAACG
jgi:cytosine/adenosine deaminase-related metal-dependent hydrolase